MGLRTSTFAVGMTALLATSAMASPRAALIGGGDCKDPELLGNLRSLTSSLKKRMSDRLVDEDAVRERLRPSAQRSADELKRQLDAARMQYYQADFKRAEGGITAVRDEARNLAPNSERFKLWAESELLLALLYRDTNRADLADESFRRVLRVQNDYELDADLFSPNTRQRFDKLRREIATGKRGKLEVRSNPSGSDVFLEGVKLGKTPLAVDVPAGTYAFAVTRGELVSLPRQLTIAGPLQLHVDLAFEGSIQPTRVTCLADSGDEGVRLLNAVKLATLLDVEEVVVLRLDRASSGPAWLAASLVNVPTAQKVREGGLKLTGTMAASPEALDELATFVMTGERTSHVETPPSAVANGAVIAEVPSTTNMTVAATTEASATSALSWKRPASYGLGGVGVLSLGASVFFLAQSGSARAEFDTYRLPNGSIDPARRIEAAAARDRADSSQTLGIVALGVGAAATGAAAYLFLTSSDAAVAVIPQRDGAVFSASFSF